MQEERDYFAETEDIVVPDAPDIGPAAISEGDEAAMDAAQAEIEAEPPAEPEVVARSRDEPADVAQRERYAVQSGLSGGLPTEEPEDPTIQWSPRPGIVGCAAKGYHKIR